MTKGFQVLATLACAAAAVGEWVRPGGSGVMAAVFAGGVLWGVATLWTERHGTK